MFYKTIVLVMLQQRPELYEQLRSKRTLLPALNRHANQLKASHETWKDQLRKARPGSHESQIASEALEFALQEMEVCLPTESSPNDHDPISLDAGMAYIRLHSPPA